MSIKSKLSVACLLLILTSLSIGLFFETSQRRMASLGMDIYDRAFMAMSYLRSSQNGLARLRETAERPLSASGSGGAAGLAARGAPVAAVVLQEILSDVQVAHERAMSDEGARATNDLVHRLAALDPELLSRDLGSVRAEVDRIREMFDTAVEIYAGDGYLYRRKVQDLVDSSVRQTGIAMASSVALALVITLALWVSIVPALRFAVGVARAISAGKLDTAFSVKGSDETAILLRTMSEMQDSLVDKIARIDALAAEAQSRAAELAIQNGRFEAALGNMHHGLCMVDAGHRLVVANHRFTDMFHSAPRVGDDMRGWPLFPNLGACLLACAPTTEEMADGRIIRLACQAVWDGGWVVTFEDVTERQQAESQLFHMARHDALTRLPNRVLFGERVDDAVKRLGRGEGFAVLCLDLDRFKHVNDTLGHPAGDELLRQVADRLGACVREVDTVCRLGGDEFAIVQCGVAGDEDTAVLAKRIIETIGRPIELDGRSVSIDVSIGIAKAPRDGASRLTLMKNADAALYRSKGDGHGVWRCFEPEMDAKLQARNALEIDLQRALAEDQFEILYQPIYDVAEDRIGGFEALLRWHHPTRGMVSPAEFIPAAEETGLIVPIGEWVLRSACLEASRWPAHVKVAVNVSPAQFRSSHLLATTSGALAASGLTPSRLELEITETVLLSDAAATLDALHGLRGAGVSFALDDFGTGYSSLNYLLSFPFDKIKIDRSFIRDLTTRSEAGAIVRAVTRIASDLGMRVTAEGVEVREQLDRLRIEGCDEVQGFYFSRPVAASQVAGLMLRLDGALA